MFLICLFASMALADPEALIQPKLLSVEGPDCASQPVRQGFYNEMDKTTLSLSFSLRDCPEQ